MYYENDKEWATNLSKYIIAIAGGFCVSLGLSVIIGWHTHNLKLIKISSEFPAMVYNTALCFLLFGSGILTALFGRLLLTSCCGAVIVTITLIKLSEYIFGINTGIENILMRPYTGNTMARLTALSLGLSGLALLVISRPASFRGRSFITGLLGSLITSLGLTAILGYLLGYYSGFSLYFGLAIHTGAGIVVAGLGILAFALRESRLEVEATPSWLPIAAFISIVLATLYLWQAMLIWEGKKIEQLHQSGIIDVKSELSLLPAVILASGLLTATMATLILHYYRIAQTRRREAEIAQSRFAGILDIAEDAIISIGEDQRIQLFNQGAEKIFGYKVEEVIGQPLDLFLAERFVESHRQHIREFAHSPETARKMGERREIFGRRKNGSEFPAEASISKLDLHNEKIFTVILHDISERKKREDAVLRLAAIVESSDDAIIGQTLDCIITSWNSGAERMYGYSATEMLGRSIFIIIPLEYSDEAAHIASYVQRGKRIDHFETVRIRKDGERINVSLSVAPVKDKYGTVTGVSTIARDISERKKMEKERAQLLAREQVARKEAESANRLKDEFLAVVSHEVRTPLTAILGWVQMLRKGRLDWADQTRALETIERNAKAQAEIIDDLLDVSRIVAGKLVLNTSPIELAPIIESAINSTRMTANAKRIELKAILDTNIGKVEGDTTRLQQIFWNLLSNAIKFTSAGGEVVIRMEKIDSKAEITISDTGQGINPEVLPFIFDRFRQANSMITRKHGGLGLGLSIVHQLVEAHNGKIEAYSEGEGKGATFRVELPLLCASKAEEKMRVA